MPTRTSPWPAGTPCWADIGVDDAGRATRFYRDVLGWSLTEADGGGYRFATVDGHAVAGVHPKPGGHGPTFWLLHIAGDADTAARAVADHGGTVLFGPDDAGEVGRFLVAADPTGAAFGVWQAGTRIGAELTSEPGGIAWEDLRSSDPAAAQSFYRGVFGYELHEVGMAPGDYRTFHHPGDDAPLGGMGGFMGPAGPSHWLVYFAVADVDRAVAAVASGGGALVTDPADTPFGRMAAVTDPEGAAFMVFAPTGPTPDRQG